MVTSFMEGQVLIYSRKQKNQANRLVSLILLNLLRYFFYFFLQVNFNTFFVVKLVL